MEILKERTKSICPICFEEIAARVVESNNRVYLEKECSFHGAFNVLIEKDIKFYKEIMNKEFCKEKIPFGKLALPITYRCNLSCPMCYAPDKGDRDFPLEKLIETIKKFNGYLIKITGGEPTLREDLPLLIKTVKKKGIFCSLVSNGVKLADFNYVKMLKKAGLTSVTLAFSTFNDDVHQKIRGQKLLEIKLKALRNLKMMGINVTLSTTLVRGINEGELKKIYQFYLKNRPFINSWRIRTMSPIGRFIKVEPFCLSEILELISEATGFTKEELIRSQEILAPCPNATCRFRISIYNAFLARMINKYIDKKRFSKLNTILKRLFLFGFKQTRIFRYPHIEIRCWPNKYSLDLGENQWCMTAILNKQSTLAPFCYSIIMDEKNCV